MSRVISKFLISWRRTYKNVCAYETSKSRAWPEQCSSTTLKAVRRTLERYKNNRERDRERERGGGGRKDVCIYGSKTDKRAEKDQRDG